MVAVAKPQLSSRRRRVRHSSPANQMVRYVAPSDADGSAISPAFLDSLAEVRALTAPADAPAPKPYDRADLDAIAEVAYHYLFAGAYRVANVLYEGVAALAPDVAAYTMGVGLTADHLGDVRGARAAYQRATKLDPSDPRPEINLAELALDAGDLRLAVQRLQRAVTKADRIDDKQLADKARAILAHVRETRR